MFMAIHRTGRAAVPTGSGALLVLLLIGCGEAPPPASIEARPQAVAGASSEVSSAEPAAESPRIEGRWAGRLLIDPQMAKQLDPASVKAAESAELQIQYRPDGVLRMSAAMQVPGHGRHASEFEGRWELIDRRGETVTIRSIDPEGKTEEIRLRFLDDDTLETTAPDELGGYGTLKLHRKG